MIRVFNVADAVFIDGYRAALIAGSLVVAAVDDAISIATAGSSEALAAGPYTMFGRQDGTGFADAPTCLAYLQATCAQLLQRVPTVAGVAGETIAAGMPVARSRTDGTLRLARADTYALASLAGLAVDSATAGFSLEAVRSSLDLPDWTAVTGGVLLSSGQRYFLAATGGLTSMPSLGPAGAGLCVVAAGYAASQTEMVFQPSDPILL